jgi:hypothetical protein
MSNWYRNLSINIKSKEITPENILDALSKKYNFDMKNVTIYKDKNSLSFDGYEGFTISRDGRIPDIDDIFKDITLAYPNCIYDGKAICETSLCGGAAYYKIICNHGTLEISAPPWASEYQISYYDNYEDFFNDNGDYISQECFEKYRNEESIYQDERGNVYTWEEYLDSYETIFSCDIKKLVDNENGINIDRADLLEKIKNGTLQMSKVPELLKTDRDFVFEAVKVNGFAILDLHNDLAFDREIVLEAVKNNGYVFDFLPAKFQQDEELIKISDELLKQYDEEQEMMGELVEYYESKGYTDYFNNVLRTMNSEQIRNHYKETFEH